MAEVSMEATAGSGAMEFPMPSITDSFLSGRKRTFDMFNATNLVAAPEHPDGARMRVAVRLLDEYADVALPERVAARAGVGDKGTFARQAPSGPLLMLTDAASGRPSAASSSNGVLASGSAPVYSTGSAGSATSTALVALGGGSASAVDDVVSALNARSQPKGISPESAAEFAKVEALAAKAQASSRAMIVRRATTKIVEPKWHAPWKLMRVISGHIGWVKSIAVEPGNEWFATGAADRTIKIWDLASGTLRVTLTGHINTVRALAISSRHPYLFSAGEDKLVKCWDLETNKCIRHYHGHLSGVYSLALHPTLDVLMTGGRDSVCRVWDMRTKAAVHVLTGHENSIASILTNSVDPQVITGSMDNTVRMWDLAAGKVMSVLTHHKKSIRAMAAHPKEFTFISGGADNLKKWALPEGIFLKNFSGHNSIINALAMNDDGVVVSGGDDGSLRFWDYETSYAFQDAITKVQPGSLESEAGIYGMTFDQSGSRLLTVEADKSIKVWREDPDASPESHPIDMKAWADTVRAVKRY